MYVVSGVTRHVLLVGAVAVKVPNVRNGWRAYLCGLLANMTERDFARYDGCCPVRYALPGGFLVVAHRARVMTDEEFDGFDPVAFCDRDDYLIPAEHKPNSFGWLDGRIVAVDYGRTGL